MCNLSAADSDWSLLSGPSLFNLTTQPLQYTSSISPVLLFHISLFLLFHISLFSVSICLNPPLCSISLPHPCNTLQVFLYFYFFIFLYLCFFIFLYFLFSYLSISTLSYFSISTLSYDTSRSRWRRWFWPVDPFADGYHWPLLLLSSLPLKYTHISLFLDFHISISLCFYISENKDKNTVSFEFLSQSVSERALLEMPAYLAIPKCARSI